MPASSWAREQSGQEGGGNPAIPTSLLKVFTASMLLVLSPRARGGRGGGHRTGWRELDGGGGAAARRSASGRLGRCDPGAGVERQALAGKVSLRGSEAWPLGRAERRSGKHRRCRGGLAAGGGGAGPRCLLFSAPLCLGLLPYRPIPYTLHPFLPLPLPPMGSCFTSPPLGPQEPAAHGEDGGGSTGSSGCGIQYGGNESGRAARSSAAPASAPPGDRTAWPRRPRGNHRASAGQSVAARRPRFSCLGRPAPRRPPSARPTLEVALQSGGALWGPPLAATAKCCAKEKPKPPHKATSLGKNFAFLFLCGLAPLNDRLGFMLFRTLPGSDLKVN